MPSVIRPLVTFSLGAVIAGMVIALLPIGDRSDSDTSGAEPTELVAEADAAEDSAAPEPPPEPAKAVEPISKAELNALIQKAFARGGEKAVQRLMDQLAAEGRT